MRTLGLVPDRDLPDGYELRRCTAADVDAVADLHARRSGAHDAEDYALIAGDVDAGPGWSAAVFDNDSGRAVSTVTLLDETVRVGGVELPAGQVELVVTDEDHEGRGLAAALLEWTNREAERRGHVVMPMVGIPDFYRQFGYVHALPIGAWRPVSGAAPTVDPTVTVRPTTADDIDRLTAIQHAEQQVADIAMAHGPACWRWVVARHGSVCRTAIRDGDVVGFVRTLPPDEAAVVGELLAADAGAASTLLAAAVAARRDTLVLDRPLGVAGRAIAPWLADAPDADRDMEWYYVRLPDLVGLLDRIRPVLQHRLDEAPGVRIPDRLLISSYRFHVVADVVDGRVGEFRRGGPLQSPVGAGGAGVPVDQWAPMLFGPTGACGLERVVPDVRLGRIRDVMEVLFPPVTADVSTFYVPY